MAYDTRFDVFAISGTEVDAFICECLGRGSSLAKEVLKCKDVSKAIKRTCWMKVKGNVTGTDLRGGAKERVGRTSMEWGDAQVLDFLTTHDGGIGIFEDITFGPGDKEVTDAGLPVLVCGDEVYYWLDRTNATGGKIEAAFGQIGYGFNEVCVLTSLPVKPVPGVDVIGLEMLRVAAENTRQLVLGAYDQSGRILVAFDRQ